MNINRRVYAMIALFLICFILTSCNANKDNDLNTTEIIKTKPTIIQDNNPVNIEKMNLTLKEPEYDVFIYESKVYVLREYGIEVFENNISIDKIVFEDWKSNEQIPQSLYIEDSLIYVISEENSTLEFKSYDLSGKTVKKYNIHNLKGVIADDIIIQNNIAFICIKVIEYKMSLYAYSLSDDSYELISDNVKCITKYGDNQLLYYTYTYSYIYIQNKIIVYDPDSKDSKTYNINFPSMIKAMEYNEIDGYLYLFSNNDGRFSALSKYDLDNNSFEWLKAISNIKNDLGTDSLSFRVWIDKDNLLIKNDKDTVYLIEHIYGDWGEQPEPIRILSLVEQGYDMNRNRAEENLYNLYGEAIIDLSEKLNYAYVEIKVDKLSTNGMRDIDLESLVSEKKYDLILFTDNLYTDIKDYSVLYDLSEDSKIKRMFSEMLNGVEGLCTINDKLIGIPLTCYTRGFLMNKMKYKVNGIELPPFDWTIDDYYIMADKIDKEKNEDRLYICEEDFIYGFFRTITANILNGQNYTRDEYNKILEQYNSIYNKELFNLGKEIFNVMDYEGFFENNISTLAEQNDHRVIFPKVTKDSKIPVQMDLICLNKESSNKMVVIEFLRLLINKEICSNVHNGADFYYGYVNKTAYLPIWYKSDELWNAQPMLKEYELLLENSINLTDNMNNNDFNNVKNYIYYIFEEYRTKTISKDETIEKLYGIRE